MAREQPATPIPRLLGVLLALLLIALPQFSCGYPCDVHQSGLAKIKADITVIKEALDAYAMQHGGEYPTSLDPLVAPDEHGRRYLNQTKVPKDPWREAYGYKPPGPGQPQPRAFTLGADGVPGGTGDDADIDYAAIVDGR